MQTHKRVWWEDRLFYTASGLAIICLVIPALIWNEQGKLTKEQDRFSLLFGVQYPKSGPEKKELAPTILNRLNEVKKNLDTRMEKGGDDQLQVTFNELCQLAKSHGFSEEANLARCFSDILGGE